MIKINDLVNITRKNINPADKELFADVQVVAIDLDSEYPYQVNFAPTLSGWFKVDELVLVTNLEYSLMPAIPTKSIEDDSLGSLVLEHLSGMSLMTFPEFVELSNNLHKSGVDGAKFTLNYIQHIIKVGAFYYDVLVVDAPSTSVSRAEFPTRIGGADTDLEATPPASDPLEKLKRMVLADGREPEKGSMYKHNDHWYVCTGTGRAWYCSDNSAGDSGLEGSMVCYAYYVPATPEEVERHETAVYESAKNKMRREQLLKIMKDGTKISAWPVDAMLLWEHPQPSATVTRIGVLGDDAIFHQGQQPYLIDVLESHSYRRIVGGAKLAKELADLIK